MTVTDPAQPAAQQAAEPAPRLYRIADVIALKLLPLSRSVIYEQIRAGRLRTVKQGRARMVSENAIRDYIALLETEAEHQTTATGTGGGSARSGNGGGGA